MEDNLDHLAAAFGRMEEDAIPVVETPAEFVDEPDPFTKEPHWSTADLEDVEEIEASLPEPEPEPAYELVEPGKLIPEPVYGVKEAKADFDLVWRRERNQVTRHGKTRMSRVRKWLAEQVIEDLI